jgi:predicted amidohydrolase
MKIGVVQTRPITGDIQANIATHKQWIEWAVADGAVLIIFPELSLTGYEPTLAKELATDQDDPRFDDLQALSDADGITIGVGVPTNNEKGVCISLLLFQPHRARHVYSKSYLHPDEEAFFVRGHSAPRLQLRRTNIALAICYEISVPEHLETALKSGPGVYIASVAKFVNGISKALERLSSVAQGGSMPVLMSNCVGFADGGQCAGKTSVWNKRGALLGQLNDSDEGMLIFDTETQALLERVR